MNNEPVAWKDGNEYKITIPKDGKPVYLGYFQSIEEAKKALRKAQEK